MSGAPKLGSRVKTQIDTSLAKDIQTTSEKTSLEERDDLRELVEIAKEQLKELKLISLKLNCLQPDSEELDESDLDSLEQE